MNRVHLDLQVDNTNDLELVVKRKLDILTSLIPPEVTSEPGGIATTHSETCTLESGLSESVNENYVDGNERHERENEGTQFNVSYFCFISTLFRKEHKKEVVDKCITSERVYKFSGKEKGLWARSERRVIDRWGFLNSCDFTILTE